MCVITTGHCRFCSRSNTRRIECKEKCGDWQEGSWGENSVCQKCLDETVWLTAGPELSKADTRRVLNGSSLVDPSMMSSSTPPFDPQKWAQPIPPSPTNTQPKSSNIVPDLSLKKNSTTKMKGVIESPHASPSPLGNPSSSRQLESMAFSSNLPFETSSQLSGPLPNRAASTSNIPPSTTDTQPKSPNFVPDLSLEKNSATKMNSVIEFPHASPSLSGNPPLSRQLESMAFSSNPPFETSSNLSGPLPNRAAATSKHLSKSGSSSNPSQKSLLSLGTSLFKNNSANPSKSKSKTLASDSRSETPWPQAPGASSSKQGPTTPATTKKKPGSESLPHRTVTTSKHLSKSGSSSNPSQKSLLSLGTSLFKNNSANPSKSKPKTLASDSRSETPWPQALGALSSKQQPTTPATMMKEPGPNESNSPADFPKKPSSCFHPVGC